MACITEKQINTEFHDSLKAFWTPRDIHEQKCKASSIRLLSEQFHKVFGGASHARFVDPCQLPADLRAAMLASINKNNSTWQNGAIKYQVCWNFVHEDQWNIRVDPEKYDAATDFTVTTYPRYL